MYQNNQTFLIRFNKFFLSCSMFFRESIKLVFILFFLGISFFSKAQQGSIKFLSLGLKDGLSQSSINDMVQDQKGFMWFGTQDGLNRFDGYKFHVFKHDPTDSTSLSDNFVNCLYLDRAGTLWIGTEGGFNKYDPETETFRYYQYHAGKKGSLSNNLIKDIAEDEYGNLWVATLDGGLNKFDRSKKEFTQINHSSTDSNSLIDDNVTALCANGKGSVWIGTEGEGINRFDLKTNQISALRKSGSQGDIPRSISSIFEDSRGNLWIGAINGIFIWNPKKQGFEVPALFSGGNISKVNKIYEDKSGIIWIGTGGNGLFRMDLNGGKALNFKAKENITYSLNSDIILSIYEDETGTVWFGTYNGINRFDRTKQNFSHFRHIPGDENTLNSNVVWSVFEGHDGIIWVGTEKGLNKIDPKTAIVKHYKHGANNRNSQKNEVVFSVFEDHLKTLWIGTDAGLYTFDPVQEIFSPFKSTNNLNSNLSYHRVYAFFEDKNFNLWIGTKNGLFLLDKSRKTVTEFINDKNNPASISNNVVRSIKQDSEGNIWLATNSAGLNKIVTLKSSGSDSLFFIHYSNHDKSLKGANNNSLYIDKDGIIWIGSYGGGLYKFDPRNEKFTQFTEKQGLSNNVIYGIHGDNSGSLWMSTNKGISRFEPNTQKFHNYYESDGLQSDEFNTGAHFKSKKGQLFFGGINGLNGFFPNKIQINKIAPKVALTNFQIFNKRVPIGEKRSPLKKSIIESSEITLTHRQGVITFEFAALHFSSPDKNSYAYIMEGFDEDWNLVSQRRQATYTNLDPGTYSFRVKAANSDGVWNDEGSSIQVTILPPFWKTWWFRSAGIALILGIIFGIYKTRINVIKAQKESLERQVVERTSEILDKTKKIESQNKLLEVEKDKVEKLLLNILPKETVEELKTKGKASARHYRVASVMFTDFKGFTQIAEKVRPKDLVAELDLCFIKFDEIIEKYNIEKIKTIGDSYMCAGGLPVRNKSNPIDIVLAAMEIQRYMIELKEEKIAKGQQYWELRIGINTGELIAGVVGIKRFAYDVWGDSVNVASRMEMHGEVGKVNVSGTTYKHIKDFFDCSYRGKVSAKNKGEIDMYYVNRIKPELSANEEGTVPNDLFNERLYSALYSKINYPKAEQVILQKLEKELPKNLHYHSLAHTLDVCNTAEQLAIKEGIRGDELLMIKTAALLHDAGFIKQYEKNEVIAAEMARDILPSFGFTQDQIDAIYNMIMATQVPQNPKNLYEQILCDADLDYLGRADFYDTGEKLKKELMVRDYIKTDMEWDALQVSFLEKHKYYTKSSIELRQAEKLKRLWEIKERYKAYQS